MVIAVRYNPASPVEVRLVALVFSRQPPIPMRLEFFRIRERSIRRWLFDLADDGIDSCGLFFRAPMHNVSNAVDKVLAGHCRPISVN
jgi:hypothetical protein